MRVVLTTLFSLLRIVTLMASLSSLAWAIIPHRNIDTIKEVGITGASPFSYSNDSTWKKLQAFLPAEYGMTDYQAPTESIWSWQNFQIHVERYVRPSSPVRVILLPGLGTDGRLVSMLVGKPLADSGYETITLDLPPYGMSQYHGEKPIVYDDWVNLVIRFIASEQRKDKRPVVLFGLSTSGMLAYHVAAKYHHIAGIAGTSFLDQRLPSVRDMTSSWFVSRMASPLAGSTAHSAMGKVQLDMDSVFKTKAMMNTPDALKILQDDPRSAGGDISIKFLSSYLYYKPAVEPEAFTTCPILLLQPAKDRLAPYELTAITLRKFRLAHVTTTFLPDAGHIPLEKQGLDAMHQHLVEFITTIIRSR
jgi:pimeloyl-ACP methyl ester carboxylesterase